MSARSLRPKIAFGLASALMTLSVGTAQEESPDPMKMCATSIVAVAAPGFNEEGQVQVQESRILEAQYLWDSEAYFKGRLPADVPVGWADLGDDNAVTFFWEGKVQAIAIDNTLRENGSMAKCALNHEEVHAFLGPGKLGKPFERQMMRVLRHGGCGGIVRHPVQ